MLWSGHLHVSLHMTRYEFMRGLKASLPYMAFFAVGLIVAILFEPETPIEGSAHWLRKSAAVLAFVLLGAMVAPELSRREFRRPFLWQLGCSAIAATLVAYAINASFGGYAVALLLSVPAAVFLPMILKHA